MAVSIRLSRQGSKKRPFYRVVASEKSSPRDGRFIELLGTYDPRTKSINLERERYEYWVGVGAQPTATVKSLAKRVAKAEAEAEVPGAPPRGKPTQAAQESPKQAPTPSAEA